MKSVNFLQFLLAELNVQVLLQRLVKFAHKLPQDSSQDTMTADELNTNFVRPT